MNPKHSFLSRRTLGIAAIGAAATLLLASCGGGGGDGINGTPAADYNTFEPGTKQLTVTHRVTITVTMPDLEQIPKDTQVTQAAYDALPIVTKTINIGLDHAHAPLSTDNFLAYVTSGAYNNTIFHRVLSGFVAQGGGYTKASDGTQTHIATNAAIALESQNGLSNTVGTLAVARTSDPDSGTSEFYFNLVNNGRIYDVDPTGAVIRDSSGKAIVISPGLDYASATSPDYASTASDGYAVFGTLMDQASLNVVVAIGRSLTNASGLPNRDITITSVTVK